MSRHNRRTTNKRPDKMPTADIVDCILSAIVMLCLFALIMMGCFITEDIPSREYPTMEEQTNMVDTYVD